MTLDEAIKRYTDNAEHERTHGNLQGCLDFRQLAEWLRELKQLREQTRWIPVSDRLPKKAGDYLVVFRYMWIYRREVCYFDGNTWDKGEYDEVIKWQYLPNIEEGEG